MVVATVVSSSRGAAGTEVVKVHEDELMWGDPEPETLPYTVVCGATGLAPQVGGRGLFLLRLSRGGGYEALEVAPADDDAGPARLRTFRTYLAIERIPEPAERRRALLTYLRNAIRSEDEFVRANAIREYAAFAETFPQGLAAEDGPALAKVLATIREPELRRLAESALDRAPAAARPQSRSAAERASAAATAVLAEQEKRFDAARAKPDERAKAILDAAAQIDRAAEPLVARGLADSAPAVREAAATAAGETGMTGLGPKLLPMTATDSSLPVRRTAVIALGHLRYAGAVDTLAGLAESDPAVSREAMFALGRIRDQAALAKLRGLRTGGGDERKRLVDFLLSDEFVQQERAMGAAWAKRP
jgi:hypothetical protein